MMSVCTNAVSLNSGNISELFGGLEQKVMLDFVPGWILAWNDLPWLWAMFGSILIGLSGVLPLLVIPIDQTDNLKHGASANTLKTMLSFAVGGLLGDVFLHSLPEIFANDSARSGVENGLYILLGLLIFVITEKIFSAISKLDSQVQEPLIELMPEHINNNIKGYEPNQEKTEVVVNVKRKVTGYLNLLANAADNFTHGLSVGGAFLVSRRLGFLTTFAILVHEVPHEVGDFAILLKSGFTRWDAAVGQLCTATGGLVGALIAIFFGGAASSFEARTSWILPLTSGSFLHIALVTVLPDLLKEEDPLESFKQLGALLIGVSIMGFVGIAVEHQ